ELPPRPAPVATSTAAGGEREAHAAAAKPGVANFYGVVRERGTRKRVPGVVVTAFQGEGKEARGFEAITDAEGRFRFFDLEPGDWKVSAEVDGYFPFRTKEEVKAGEAVE